MAIPLPWVLHAGSGENLFAGTRGHAMWPCRPAAKGLSLLWSFAYSEGVGLYVVLYLIYVFFISFSGSTFIVVRQVIFSKPSLFRFSSIEVVHFWFRESATIKINEVQIALKASNFRGWTYGWQIKRRSHDGSHSIGARPRQDYDE